MWFIGVEVEQETSAPTPEKNPGSAPDIRCCEALMARQLSSSGSWLFNFSASKLLFSVADVSMFLGWSESN